MVDYYAAINWLLTDFDKSINTYQRNILLQAMENPPSIRRIAIIRAIVASIRRDVVAAWDSRFYGVSN